MNTSNAQRRPQAGIKETWLARGEETAHEFNADSHNGKSSGCHLQSSEHEQIRSYRGTSQGENATVSFAGRVENPGKITERLKLIEQHFLSYVRSNQARLESELERTQTLEQDYLAAIRELERDIESLIPQNNQVDLDNEDQQ